MARTLTSSLALTWSLALASLLAACEVSKHDLAAKAPADVPAAAPPGGSGDTAPPEVPNPVTLRLLGVNGVANGFTTAVVPIERIELRVNGAAVPFRAGVPEADLANPDQGWLLATFSMPDRTALVDASVTFGPGGRLASPGGTPAFDASGRPLRVQFFASELEARGHAVIEMDVDRSIVADGERYVLLPNLAVRF